MASSASIGVVNEDVDDQRRFPSSGPREDARPAPGGNGRGNQTLRALVDAIDNVELKDQHDFHEFAEAIRKLGHYVATQVHLGAGELEAGAKEMARSEATLGIVGFGIRSRIKRVIKPLESAAAHFAQGASDAVKSWHAMESMLDEIHTASKVTKPRGFSLDLNS